MKKKDKKKLDYVCPTFSIKLIEMESGIAAGSAPVNPSDDSSAVKSEWGEASDNSSSIAW